MAKIFSAPGRYIQGAGAISEIGAHVANIGNKVLITGGKRGLDATVPSISASFARHGIECVVIRFEGEASDAEINRIAALSAEQGCNVILASGGGKVIDTVKAAAELQDVPAVVVPTVASNDAPCSALSIVYNEDGSVARLQPLKRSPALVLVDTEIIAKAPVSQLVAGMGDAIATWYEAQACYKSGVKNIAGGDITLSAMALARLCRDTLLENGADAVAACKAGVPNAALEAVVEANTLLSGLGFESAGVALAHSLAEGMSAVAELHNCPHGVAVAFCLLVQFELEKRDEAEVTRVREFYRAVGLPLRLADAVGCIPGEQSIRRAAEVCTEPGRPAHNLPFAVDAEMVYNAIIAADSLAAQSAP